MTRAPKDKLPRSGFYQDIEQSNVQRGPGTYINKQTCTNGNCTSGFFIYPPPPPTREELEHPERPHPMLMSAGGGWGSGWGDNWTGFQSGPQFPTNIRGPGMRTGQPGPNQTWNLPFADPNIHSEDTSFLRHHHEGLGMPPHGVIPQDLIP